MIRANVRSTDRRCEAAIDSAERLFAERGFHGASMRDVARAARASIAGLYYYLPSKQAALYYVCDRIFERLEDVAAGLQSIRDPRMRLEAFVCGHLRHLIHHPYAYRVLQRDAEALEGPYAQQFQKRRRAYFSMAASLVDDLCGRTGSIPTRIAAAALFGMLNWAPTWYRQQVDGDVDAVAGQLLQLFLRGASGAPRFQEATT